MEIDALKEELKETEDELKELKEEIKLCKIENIDWRIIPTQSHSNLVQEKLALTNRATAISNHIVALMKSAPQQGNSIINYQNIMNGAFLL